jgi:hypothetical protein
LSGLGLSAAVWNEAEAAGIAFKDVDLARPLIEIAFCDLPIYIIRRSMDTSGILHASRRY